MWASLPDDALFPLPDAFRCARIEDVLHAGCFGEREYGAAPQHLARPSTGDDPARVEHSHTAAHHDGLVGIVRDVDDRQSDLVAHAKQMWEHART